MFKTNTPAYFAMTLAKKVKHFTAHTLAYFDIASNKEKCFTAIPLVYLAIALMKKCVTTNTLAYFA